MTDLNSLIPPNSPLYLLHGFGINSAGEIVGSAYDSSTGDVVGFLAIPIHFGGDAGSASSPVGSGSGGGARVLSLKMIASCFSSGSGLAYSVTSLQVHV